MISYIIEDVKHIVPSIKHECLTCVDGATLDFSCTLFLQSEVYM